MLTSMTGFGGKEGQIAPLGKVSVEIRSVNHKFLEIVLHLPEGFLFLEGRIKKEIENKVKRGRITCVINTGAAKLPEVFVNEKLLKNYMSALKNIKRSFHLDGQISLDALIHLPGVLSLTETSLAKEKIWVGLKTFVNQAVENLVKMRQKEGKATQAYLKQRLQALKGDLEFVKSRHKAISEQKSLKLKTVEERAGFLKDCDISEELERLSFHLKNFTHKLAKRVPVGKELDFIAQEMQREANTTGAKSCDSALSGRVVQIKSQIEKIREQVQNVE